MGLLGASLSLLISDIPWSGPVAGLRIGKMNDQFILNPSYEEREKADLDLVLVGLEKEEEILINMIEAEAQEIPEEIILKSYQFAKPSLRKIIDFQKRIAKEIGKEKMSFKTESID